MIEKMLYKKDGELYVCLKEINFMTYEYEDIKSKSYLSNQENYREKNIELNEFLAVISTGFKEHKNYVLLKIGKRLDKETEINISDIIYSIENIDEKQMFKGINMDINEGNLKTLNFFKESIYGIKKKKDKKLVEIVSDYKEYKEAEISNFNIDNYAKEIEKKLKTFMYKNENIISCELYSMIESEIGLLNTTMPTYHAGYTSFKVKINKGLISLSLKHGIEKSNNYYLKMLEDYKVNKLLKSI